MPVFLWYEFLNFEKQICKPPFIHSGKMKKTLFSCLLIMLTHCIMAQDSTITRIARITVDPGKLSEYRQQLKEQMDAAIRLEPGVLSYTVYADKTDPSRITIIEKYASEQAYLAHREAPHFKKYKEATKDMVKGLELTEVSPLLQQEKGN